MDDCKYINRIKFNQNATQDAKLSHFKPQNLHCSMRESNLRGPTDLRPRPLRPRSSQLVYPLDRSLCRLAWSSLMFPSSFDRLREKLAVLKIKYQSLSFHKALSIISRIFKYRYLSVQQTYQIAILTKFPN